MNTGFEPCPADAAAFSQAVRIRIESMARAAGELTGTPLNSDQRKLAEAIRENAEALLPLLDAGLKEPEIKPEMPVSESVPEHSDRILLVEDHPVNRMIAEHQLTKLGMQFDSASDGFEAAAAAKNGNYGLILMDCQLPGMDGLEATRQIRQQEAAESTRHVPIVAMTASTLQEERRMCMETGMDDFLAKPVNTEDLRALLDRWLFGGRGAETVTAASSETSTADGADPAGGEEPIVEMGRLWDCVDYDREELRQLLELYFRETAAHLAGIEEAIRRGDTLEMSRRAHRCGGSSATVGMKTMVTLLRAIEHLETEDVQEKAPPLLAETRNQFEAIGNFLKSNPETAACYPTTIPPHA